ncbi:MULTISPECIES: hypothetical protein [unclassified Bradyrhizobium]|uniref:hypothetical protein n=1 Tax=unclassified Bradyrhizobium TaxID=2631580 RepID=UPI0024792B86|nr:MULTISPECIES: hypothetical protein [unclassified Bradyrhizobium]WGS21094.1 hypothetical protein MTX22_04820 [Bradyrhizobium sp. ISRA463]WGS28011.1 hypothetical protein MTX19_02670 [Bradyrhizobium sp. ISRA464]
MLFQIGDYLAGAVIGVATAVIVRVMVSPGFDMVLAMLIGMGIGTIVSLILGYMLSPMLGIVETMVPGSLIGMYGGMLFAMRDSMAAGSRTMTAVITVGAIFGIAMTIAVKVYNYVLRGTMIEAGD